jgi:hypothetical protein
LATTSGDGSPHLTGVGALWVSGVFYFQTGETTRKGRHLARDPRCSLSVANDEFHLVVDGDAALLDATCIAPTAEYSAPSAWPSPWRAYRLTPRQATVVLTTAPGGARCDRLCVSPGS